MIPNDYKIVELGGRWYVVDKDGSVIMGEFKSKEAAAKVYADAESFEEMTPPSSD